jgi:hypothetical protein
VQLRGHVKDIERNSVLENEMQNYSEINRYASRINQLKKRGINNILVYLMTFSLIT